MYLPDPVLEHLAGRLHKVSLHVGTEELGGVRLRQDNYVDCTE